ncbi:RNase H domain-containing protein [Trichonephila clavipes]|nr:RNase H domain-containing protein [Trichonephila clavipes]
MYSAFAACTLNCRRVASIIVRLMEGERALIIYTNGSHSDTGRAGSGIFSNTPGNGVKISIRNSDHCSVFILEVIAISGALDHALNSNKDSIWIPTDSRGSIQYLKNWPIIMDSTGLDITSKLARLGQRKQVSPVDTIICGCAWERGS